jgi:glycerol-3-phosphate acyltransferase PlsY
MALAPVIIYWIWPADELIVMQIIMSIILFWRHKSNIQRLLSGEESLIGKKKS